MALAQSLQYTIDDIYALPDGERAELIDGQMYMIAPPNCIHQHILNVLNNAIYNYIQKKGGPCVVYPAPFAVSLNEDSHNHVEPDISVICDKNKLTDMGCKGAPDWIIEIVSKSTKNRDYGIKLFKYHNSGMREYWIINPMTNVVNVFDFENNKENNQYAFDEEIPSCIFEDFSIRISDFLNN